MMTESPRLSKSLESSVANLVHRGHKPFERGILVLQDYTFICADRLTKTNETYGENGFNWLQKQNWPENTK